MVLIPLGFVFSCPPPEALKPQGLSLGPYVFPQAFTSVIRAISAGIPTRKGNPFQTPEPG